MEEQKQQELFEELNLVQINFDKSKSVEENIYKFLVEVYGFESKPASKLSKKIKRSALVAIKEDGSIESSPKSLEKVAKLFISEKFLEQDLALLKDKKQEQLNQIVINDQSNQPKHLEDFLKEQIKKLLDEYFEVIEKDKNSEYKIIREFAKELDEKIQKAINEKKELSNPEINEIAAYLNGRRAYYQTLESAKMFAKIDLKSKNKMLAETAKRILEAIEKKDIGLEDLQGLNAYVMERSRFDYIFENGFLYAEKDLREEKDEQKIQKARKILSIISKDQPSGEEILELNQYVDQKEFEGSLNIVRDLIKEEKNEVNKEYIEKIIKRADEQGPISIFDISLLRSYYQEKILPIVQQGLSLLEQRDDEWAKSLVQSAKEKNYLTPFQIQEIYQYLKTQNQLSKAQQKVKQEKEQLDQIEQKEKLPPTQQPPKVISKENIIELIENIVQKANDLQDEQKIDLIIQKVEKAEKELQEVESIKNKKEKQASYKRIWQELEEFSSQIF
ncbi:MAG: hypothetical protein QXV83_02180 [Candidatus Anstonellaceae archaeon]